MINIFSSLNKFKCNYYSFSIIHLFDFPSFLSRGVPGEFGKSTGEFGQEMEIIVSPQASLHFGLPGEFAGEFAGESPASSGKWKIIQQNELN